MKAIKVKWLIILSTILWTVDISESKIGQKCKSRCGSDYAMEREEVCKDGICQCSPKYEIKYMSDLDPICDGSLQSLTYMFADPCTPESCGENKECVERSLHAFYKDKKVCVCKSGYVKLNSECREAIFQNANKPCYAPKNGTVMACDLNVSICKNGKCICHDTFFVNSTSGNCESKASYMKAYNLTEYRVKPNEYCSSTSDCIAGLTCEYFSCKCPEPCWYNSTAEICDCGTEDPLPLMPVTAPAVVGVLLGILIMVFWYKMIMKTIKKHAKKKNATERASTEQTLHPLPSRTDPSSSTPREATAPSPIPEKVSLISDSRPGEDTNVPPPLPPQPSQYGFTTPQAPSAPPPGSSVSPPAYSPFPPANEPPPPYSLNPLEGGDLTFVPNSSTSSALPYPYNATDPYPSKVNPYGTSEAGCATAPPAEPSFLHSSSSPSFPNSSAINPVNPSGPDGATAPSSLPYPVSPGITDPISVNPSAPVNTSGSGGATAPSSLPYPVSPGVTDQVSVSPNAPS